ncbi:MULTISPECIES: hypothetical protein [Microcoleaceae]|uniref:hypothetical protein n=1 Tax=Microcoleaceae TaxID=1892252 RepID=UPI001881B6F6|nr:hypothetical protein [Tychonema sp. LEGE 06208]MBE9165852.1 hypothetical protein [Tychonema sp. LEGE 06208]
MDLTRIDALAVEKPSPYVQAETRHPNCESAAMERFYSIGSYSQQTSNHKNYKLGILDRVE